MDDTSSFRGIPKEQIFEQLIADRNHHFSHPQSVNLKAGVTAATFAITTSVIAPSVWGMFFILAGVALLGWGLYEHNAFHVVQRRRLEQIIQEAIATDTPLAAIFENDAKMRTPQTPIFISEPDLRKGIANHDFKVFVGIALLVIAAIACAFKDRESKSSTPHRITFETPLRIEKSSISP